ncbi:hypothetical protein GR11A_00151 [Vibrio phage vB_VcorM_GR11A]|nr:hypothetical protein GR11A_00151 [Vibrio phage vB_VcorM_GR11A]
MANRSRGFGGLKTGGDKPKRLADQVEMLQLPKDGTWTTVRIIGEVYSTATRWIDIITQKGQISIPKTALNYDAETDDFDSTIEDPYESIPNPQRVAKEHYVNVLVRDLEDSEPKKNKPTSKEKESGFKDKSSKSWTPIRVLRVPPGLAGKLASLIALNKHKTKKGTEAFELSDPEFGCDVHVAYDESKSPSEKYSVQKADHSPLSKSEKKLLVWDILGNMTQPETLDAARAEAEKLMAKAPVDEDADDDGDDDDDFKVKDKKKKKGKDKKSKSKDDKPAKKSKKSKLDIDDDFKDDKKSKKSKGGKDDKKSKSKSKKSDDKPSKSKDDKKSKSKGKKKK